MNPRFYTFLDDVNGLDDLPSEINNFVIYWDSFLNIIDWIDLRNEELDTDLSQLIPTRADVSVMRDYIESVIYS